MNAMQMMAKKLMDDLIGNLPPELMQNIGQIGQTVASFKAQLDRIEAQNRLIMDHLKIGEVEHEHEKQPGRNIGSGAGT